MFASSSCSVSTAQASKEIKPARLKMKIQNFGLSQTSVGIPKTIQFDPVLPEYDPDDPYRPIQSNDTPELYVGTHFHTYHSLFYELCIGIRLEKMHEWYGKGYTRHSTSKLFVACRQATRNYRDMRENGDTEDDPRGLFPNDGMFRWENKSGRSLKVIYEEGTNDCIWMKRRDANYLKKEIRKMLYDFTPLPKELIEIVVDYLTCIKSLLELSPLANNRNHLWRRPTQSRIYKLLSSGQASIKTLDVT